MVSLPYASRLHGAAVRDHVHLEVEDLMEPLASCHCISNLTVTAGFMS